MVVIGGARSCPGLQWKWIDASSSGALLVYRARTVHLASSKCPRLQLQAYSLHPQLQVGGLSCQCGSKRRSFWFCRNLGLTIHSSRTRFVAPSVCMIARAGRLNSGVMRGRAMIRLASCKRLLQLLLPGGRLPLASAISSRAGRSVWEAAPMRTAPLPSAGQALPARSPSPTYRFSPPGLSRLRIASAARLRRLAGAA